MPRCSTSRSSAAPGAPPRRISARRCARQLLELSLAGGHAANELLAGKRLRAPAALVRSVVHVWEAVVTGLGQSEHCRGACCTPTLAQMRRSHAMSWQAFMPVVPHAVPGPCIFACAARGCDHRSGCTRLAMHPCMSRRAGTTTKPAVSRSRASATRTARTTGASCCGCCTRSSRRATARSRRRRARIWASPGPPTAAA